MSLQLLFTSSSIGCFDPYKTTVISSHSSDGVLKEFYIDRKILTGIEKGALDIKIFT